MICSWGFFMVDAISSSLNGLYHATQRLSKVASNIAKSNVSDTAGGSGGNINHIPVNLDEELVNSKLSEIGYSANAKVIKAQLDTQKELLDILA